MSRSLRNATLFLLTGVALAVVVVGVDERFFSIPGVNWRMPIPLTYWVLGLLFAWCASRFSSVPLKTSIALTVGSWFIAELGVLFIDLAVRLKSDNPLNPIYSAYITGVGCVIFGLVAYRAARYLRSAPAGSAGRAPYGIISVAASAVLLALCVWRGLWLDLSVFFVVFLSSLIRDAGPTLRRAWESLATLTKERWKYILFLYLVSLALRIAFSCILLGQVGDRYTAASCDGILYDTFGWMIAQDPRALVNGSVTYVVFGPYYWIFLGIVYKTFGHNFYAAAFAQSAITSSLPVITYLIMRESVKDERSARLSGVLTAFCMSLIYIGSVLEPESLMIPFFYLYLLSLIRYARSEGNHYWNSFASGAFMAVANGTRSVMSYFPAFGIAWLIFFCRTMTFRRKAVNVTIFLLSLLLFTAPLDRICRANVDTISLKTTSSALMSPAACTYDSDGSKLAKMGFNPFSDPAGALKMFLHRPKMVSRLFLEAAAFNTHRFFFLNFFGYFNPYILVVPAKYPNQFGAIGLFYMYACMLFGGILFFTRKYRGAISYLFAFLFAYYLLTHPFFFLMLNARYRTPLHPLFIMLFSIGAVHLFEVLKEWRESFAKTAGAHRL